MIFLRNNKTTRPAKKVPKIKCSFKLFNKLEMYIESSDTTSSLTPGGRVLMISLEILLFTFSIIVKVFAFAILETPILMASSPFLFANFLSFKYPTDISAISLNFRLPIFLCGIGIFFSSFMECFSKSKLTNNSDLLLL